MHICNYHFASLERSPLGAALRMFENIWGGLPFPSQVDLPNSGIEPQSIYPSEKPGKPTPEGEAQPEI